MWRYQLTKGFPQLPAHSSDSSGGYHAHLPWGVRLLLLDTLTKAFILLLEEQWNCYPVVNTYIATLEFFIPIGGFYSVTSLQGFCWAPASLPVCPFFFLHTQLLEQRDLFWLQQAYTHLLCSRCYSLLILWGRVTTSPDLSFFKIWLPTSFYKKWKQTRISKWRFGPSSEVNPTVPDSLPLEAVGYKLCSLLLPFLYIQKRWLVEGSCPRLNQQSLNREALNMEECLPSHLLPIHQSTLLPNPQGTSVPEWQNCLLQACVGKRYMHQ